MLEIEMLVVLLYELVLQLIAMVVDGLKGGSVPVGREHEELGEQLRIVAHQCVHNTARHHLPIASELDPRHLNRLHGFRPHMHELALRLLFLLATGWRLHEVWISHVLILLYLNLELLLFLLQELLPCPSF